MLARAEVLRDERRNITGCLLEQCHRRPENTHHGHRQPSASVDQLQGRCGQWSAAIPEAIGDDKRPGNSEDLLPALRGMKFSVPWGVFEFRLMKSKQ